MKKILFILSMLVVNRISAQDLNVTCVQAAGYYANISIQEQSDSYIVKAQQGFAYSIANNLSLPESHLMLIKFQKSQCKSGVTQNIQCEASSYDVLFSYFDIKNHIIKLESVSLSFKEIKKDKFSVNLSATHNDLNAQVQKDFVSFDIGEGCFFNH